MWRAWFQLTSTERNILAAICLIFLIGLVARHLHLRSTETPPEAPVLASP